MARRRLEGLRALVTGASAGIGEAIAQAFVEHGCDVVVSGRDEVRTGLVARRLGATAVVADLADPAQVENLAVEACADGLDILVNNAGFERGGPLAQLDVDDLRSVFEVNVVAPTMLMRLCRPTLAHSTSASVINMTSIHETVPVADNGAYAASKAALAMVTRTAAVEWGHLGIRVNNLAPGAVRTAMNADLLDAIGMDVFERWIPAGRVGGVAEIAQAAVFLASAESSYVTGTTLTVDGGYSDHLVRYPATDS